MNKIFKRIGHFFNKGNTMDNDDGRTDEQSNAQISASNATASATAAAATNNVVYNADGSVTYYNGAGNTYTVSSSGYVVCAGGSGGASTTTTTTAGAAGYAAGYASSYSSLGSFSSISYSPPIYKASIDYMSGKVTAQNFILNGGDVGKILSTICDRLAIIENADPEQLAKYKALTEAYEKYKFLENLLTSKGDDNGK